MYADGLCQRYAAGSAKEVTTVNLKRSLCVICSALIGVALLVAAWFIILTSVPSHADASTFIVWHPMKGPYGGEMWTVEFHPRSDRIVYAGGPSGFYRSDDGGSTWNALRISDLPVAHVRCLCVSPSMPSLVLASTENEGIFRSWNKGLTWEPIAYVPKSTIAISPNYGADRTVFAWWYYIDPRDYTLQTGISKIVDTEVVTTVNLPAEALAVAPTYDDIGPGVDVFAATPNSFHYTRDGGTTWETLATISKTLGHVYTIALSPSFAEDRTLYVGTSSIGPQHMAGLFKSTNGGFNWRFIGGNLPEGLAVRKIVLAPDYLETSNQRTLYIVATSETSSTPLRIYRSVNGGETWMPVEPEWPVPEITEVWDISLSPHHSFDHTLLVATSLGMYRTTDRGATWEEVNEGINGAYVSALAASQNQLYARVWVPQELSRDLPDTIHQRTPDGSGWVPIEGQGLPPADIRRTPRAMYPPDLAALPDDSALFAWGFRNRGVYRSWDHGETWEAANNGLTVPGFEDELPTVHTLHITPRAPYTMYAVTEEDVFWSTDAGESWTRLVLPVPRPVVALTTGGRNFRYLYVLYQNGLLFRSADNGVTWENLSNRIPPYPLPWEYLKSYILVAHPTQPEQIFLGGGFPLTSKAQCNRFYLSSDEGEHWVNLSTRVPSRNVIIGRLYISPYVPDTLWLLVRQKQGDFPPDQFVAQGLYASTDWGLSWHEVRLDPQLIRGGIRDMYIDASGRMYFATAGHGIWTGDEAEAHTVYVPMLRVTSGE